MMKLRSQSTSFYFFIVLVYTLIFPFGSSATTYTSIRFGKQETGVRIVLDCPSSPEIGVFLGDNNQTLLLNLKNTLVNPQFPQLTFPLKSIALEPLGEHYSQIILSTNVPVKIVKKFLLSPTKQGQPFRYVIDIQPLKQMETVGNAIQERIVQKKKKVIIIDAGHGGADPGAIGHSRTKEKDITLRCAKIVAKTLAKNPQYKVVLTRGGDYYVTLKDRVKKGRTAQGDLFISLHADSHPKRQTRGLSIYTLSKIASDKEAARLAAKENKADLALGIDLDAETPEVANILLDLTKRETMNLSVILAKTLTDSLKKRVSLLDRTHRFANFAVLRTPDVPAVLIELGYISNPQDEKLLKSSAYLSKIAEGVTEAVYRYYQRQNNA